MLGCLVLPGRSGAYQVVGALRRMSGALRAGSSVAACCRWRGTVGEVGDGLLTLFLCGDVMTGRGVDQVCRTRAIRSWRERYAPMRGRTSAWPSGAHGRIPRPAGFAWPWGMPCGCWRMRAGCPGDQPGDQHHRSRGFAPGQGYSLPDDRVTFRAWPRSGPMPARWRTISARFRPPGAAGHLTRSPLPGCGRWAPGVMPGRPGRRRPSRCLVGGRV